MALKPVISRRRVNLMRAASLAKTETILRRVDHVPVLSACWAGFVKKIGRGGRNIESFGALTVLPATHRFRTLSSPTSRTSSRPVHERPEVNARQRDCALGRH